MESKVASGDVVVLLDTWPFRIGMLSAFLVGGIGGVRTLMAAPIVGVPIAVRVCIAAVALIRKPPSHTVANADGVSGLLVDTPRSDRSLFSRRRVDSPLIPWDHIERVRTDAGFWGSTVRVELADGRDARVDANVVGRRGLAKIVADLEAARARFD